MVQVARRLGCLGAEGGLAGVRMIGIKAAVMLPGGGHGCVRVVDAVMKARL